MSENLRGVLFLTHTVVASPVTEQTVLTVEHMHSLEE